MNYGLLGYTWITNHGSDSWDAHPSMRAAQYGTLNTVSSYRMAPPATPKNTGFGAFYASPFGNG